MLPCHSNTKLFSMQPFTMSIACSRYQGIISANLKATFTNTNIHVIISSQLTITNHNNTTSTHLHSSTYQLFQNICVSTIVLKQNHSSCNIVDTYSYHAINQTIKQHVNIPCYLNQIYNIIKLIPQCISGEAIKSAKGIRY